MTGIIHDFSTKEGVIKAIRWECVSRGLTLKTQHAYVIATVAHETNDTFQPVREAYWLSEDWRKKNLRYYPYYGRGYVQITWDYNYAHYSEVLGVNLLKDPDICMRPPVALYILVDGFKNGIFTGKKLTDYVNDKGTDFKNARRCINGLDRAEDIAKRATAFLKQL
jgi:predicted chitinase